MIDDFIFGSIIHTALHEVKMKKLREDNLILNKNIFKMAGTDSAAFYIDEEIMNIRRIEAEIHNFDGKHNFKDFENLLISSGFDYKKRMLTRDLMLISAKNRYIG